MRLLITGSRDWAETDILRAALRHAGGDLPVCLVHGACPTGADAMADAYGHERGWTVEPHPADWSRGRKAGPERNAAMVALGADLCLAFIGDCTSPRCDLPGRHPSHGATGCADLAEAAGIETRRFYDDPQADSWTQTLVPATSLLIPARPTPAARPPRPRRIRHAS